ncbi:MAG TPA: carboxypeptidase regulatory-like domain-containing protein [Patescibacteria group bacterium]|nr:carboxypeptidase regulatory-like domain-containing protein [Patescibacteria group bacterium]
MHAAKQVKKVSRARAFGAALIALCFATVLIYQNCGSVWAAEPAASHAVIRGVVTGGNGQPIRGALVTVSRGSKTVSRLSGSDGHFAIPVPAGNYRVSVTAHAFGFHSQEKTGETGHSRQLRFRLEPGIRVTSLTSTEVMSVMPDTPRSNLIQTTCFNCHGSATILKLRGSPATVWQGFLPAMAKARGSIGVNPKMIPAYSQALEEYFGPHAPYFSPGAAPPKPSQIEHASPSNAALQATIVEWKIRTSDRFAMVHSVTVDPKTGMVWFAGIDYQSNDIVSFNPRTEKFTYYPLPIPDAEPHTGAVMKDGGYIVALSHDGIAAKLAAVEHGKMVLYDWPEKTDHRAHTAKMGPNGRYVWITAGMEVWSFDLKTHQWKAYTWPVPAAPPAGSMAAIQGHVGGFEGAGSYDLAVDRHGIVWISLLPFGSIVRLDPRTGATKLFHTAGVRSVRGVAVDGQGNVWFGDYYGHKLGVLDTKTGIMTEYQPPTPNATPYGVAIDPRTGDVWYADTMGNYITRFDPKTKQFAEYPEPTPNSSSRFLGVDAEGRAWYGGFFGGQLGMINPNGGSQEAVTAYGGFKIVRSHEEVASARAAAGK